MNRMAFVMAAVAVAPLVAVQQATFSSRAVAVRVDVSVTARGRPVTGLTPADFEILDNGVRQTIEVLDAEQVPIDLMMALDVSGSVTGERLEDLRAASKATLGLLKPGDRAGVLTFDQQIVLRAPLSDDFDAAGRALDGNRWPVNRTSLVDAAYTALALADGGQGRALAIVFSDGLDTASWLRAQDVIETARRLDVVLFGVATGAPRRNVLDDLADASGGDLIRIESTRELTATLEQLMRDFRLRYLLSYTPQGVAAGGWHTLDVRVRRRGVQVKARDGYFSS